MSNISRSVRDFSRVSTGAPCPGKPLRLRHSGTVGHYKRTSISGTVSLPRNMSLGLGLLNGPSLSPPPPSALLKLQSFAQQPARQWLCWLWWWGGGKWELERNQMSVQLQLCGKSWTSILTRCLGCSCKIIQSNCQRDPIHETTCHWKSMQNERVPFNQ